MNPAYVGIDPGLKGGVALYTGNNSQELHRMITLGVGESIDARWMYDLLRNWGTMYHLRVVIEKVHAMPGQGVTSMFTFGMGYGKIQAVVECLQLPHYLVTPQSWKKEVLIGTAKDKAAAIEYCQRSFPEMVIFGGKLTDGQADALCLATYGWRYYGTREYSVTHPAV